MFQRARVVYFAAETQGEESDAVDKKTETPGITPDEKKAKLGTNADDLKHAIELHKANDNPQIKKLAASAEAKLAALEAEDKTDYLSEGDKRAILQEVRAILDEADQRAAYEYEQTKAEVKSLGAAARGEVVDRFNDYASGLDVSVDVSGEAKEAIQKLAAEAAFIQMGMLDTKLTSAKVLHYDDDPTGQKLSSIKNELSGDEPVFRAELVKVYHNFIAQRDSLAALDAASSDPAKLEGQVNADWVLAFRKMQKENDPQFQEKTAKLDQIRLGTIADLKALAGPDKVFQRAQRLAQYKDAVRAVVRPGVKDISASLQMERDISRPEMLAQAKAKMEGLRNKSYNDFKAQESYVKQLEAAAKGVAIKYPNGIPADESLPVAPKAEV